MPDIEYQRVNDTHIAEIKVDVAVLKTDVAEIKAAATLATGAVAALHGDVQEVRDCVKKVQSWVEDNASVTRDIKDTLVSFRLIGSLSKWLAVVGSSVAVTYAAFKGWIDK